MKIKRKYNQRKRNKWKVIRKKEKKMKRKMKKSV